MSTADGTVLGTTKIVDHGPNTHRWNLVILADGYRASEMGTFAGDAQAFVNRLFSVKPFNELQGAINVHRIDVASTDSGADDPTACGGTGATPRTYFDATFCTNGIPRLLTVSTAPSCRGRSAGAQWHVALVLVNSPNYGGAGGSVAVASRAPSATDIALHEIGHTRSVLPTNTSITPAAGWIPTAITIRPVSRPSRTPPQRNRSFLKWRAFVTALPCRPRPIEFAQCDGLRPGAARHRRLVRGAHYYHCGALQAEFDCRMRNVATSSVPFAGKSSQPAAVRAARQRVRHARHRTSIGCRFRHAGGHHADVEHRLRAYWWNSNAPGMPWNGHSCSARTSDTSTTSR